MQLFTVLRNKRLGRHLHILKTCHSLFKTKERFQSETPPQFCPPRWVGIIDHKTFQAFPLHFCIHSKTGYWVKAWDGGYRFSDLQFASFQPRLSSLSAEGVWRRMVNSVLPLGVFVLKLIEWWYSTESSAAVRMMTSLPVPPPPPHTQVSM